MEARKTPIDGLMIITPDVFSDDRGYFYESFSAEKYEKLGINEIFVQDNISRSKYGTIRGLHYQVGEFSQGKLCSVLQGRVLDVAVDIRSGSPTFGKYLSVELSDKNHQQMWIPPGFAHGFAVLSDKATFHYKCTNYFRKDAERTILFNDKDLNIDWMIQNPIVSEKDLHAKRFSEIDRDFKY